MNILGLSLQKTQQGHLLKDRLKEVIKKFADNLIKVFNEHNRRAAQAPKKIYLKNDEYLENGLINLGIILEKH